MFKLDAKDRKILFELDKDSRQPFSAIARAVRLRKETCIYRVNRLVDEGIITNFSTIMGLGNLGLFSCRMYFQFHALTEEVYSELLDHIKSNRRVNWLGECTGNWDLLVSFLCRDVKEFDEEKDKILERYSDYILNYTSAIMSDAFIYNRDYLVGRKSGRQIEYIGPFRKTRPDRKDVKILKSLSSSSRFQKSKLAVETGLNIKTVTRRIRDLEKAGIIKGYKIFMDLNKIGYKFFKALIYINKMEKEEYGRFLAYCRDKPNIIHLVKNIGYWEFEPEFEIEDEERFYLIMNEMKNLFPRLIKRIEFIRIVKEHKGAYFLQDFL